MLKMNKELQGLSFWERLKEKNIYTDGNFETRILTGTFPGSESESRKDLGMRFKKYDIWRGPELSPFEES